VRARKEAVGVVRTLREAGHVAYFAGGCVRDELLGQHPTDFDVATDATPDRLRALFRRTHAVGAAFGVMLVHQNGVSIEVATFRAEGPYTDKRRPDAIRFASAEEDARRRDFTINALFLDPVAQPGEDQHARLGVRVEGRVIDLVGGVSDLRAGIVRAVGDADARLSEDHLRALRAVRFASRFGFAIDPSTAEAVRRHARELQGISRERIGEELKRMLGHSNRAAAARALTALGLDEPALRTPRSAGSPDDCPRVAAVPPEPPYAPYPAALAAWALDRVAGPHRALPILTEDEIAAVSKAWRASLCLSNFDRDGLVAILQTHAQIMRDWIALAAAKRRRLAARQAFRPALALVACDDPERSARARTDLLGMGVNPDDPPPVPLITGDDLIAGGFRPGPHFKGILDALYDAQLEDRIKDRAEGLDLAKREYWTNKTPRNRA